MPLTKYYHVRDPIENLLVSVTLRKISGFGTDASKDPAPVGTTWRYRFRWQEKKLSLSEKKREQERLEAKGIQLSSRKRGGRKGSDSDASDVLSSYVDVDDYIPAEFVKDPPSTSKAITHLAPPDLNRRPHNTKHSSYWTVNHQRAWLRSNREDKFRAMHIVAFIEGAEHVICSLRFYKESGLLCTTPGFSTPIVDLENDPDLLVKGPKLSTYQLSTLSGCLYEFVVDNTNDLLPYASAEDQRLTREIRLQEEKRDRAEVVRWQNAGNNPALASNMADGQRKLMLSLEVVSIDSPQSADPIFVEFELALPDHGYYPQWQFQSGDSYRREGTTPLSRPHRSGYLWWASSAAFGWHKFFKLKFVTEKLMLLSQVHSQVSKDNSVDDVAARPILYLSIYSRDSWRRKRTEGYAELRLQTSSGFYDFDVPIRRPILSIRDQVEELFIGKDDTDINHRDKSHQHELSSFESRITSMITSRLGQKSETTSSTIRIRYNVAELHPPKHGSGSNTSTIASSVAVTSQANTRVVKRSVQEILQSVKLEKRIASITDPRLQAAMRFMPSGTAAVAASIDNNASL